MNRILSALLTTSSLLACAALSTPYAAAQCGGGAPNVKKVSFLTRPATAGSFKLAGYQLSDDNRWGDERDEHGLEPIVGLWHVDMEDPAMGYADHGYTAWHSDHTEFFNSTKAPGTGAVCQGVWVKVGKSSYVLNHFALGYNGTVASNNLGTTTPNETEPAQIVQIKEFITVSPNRKTFSGTFSVEIYTYTDHKLLVAFHGPVTAKRITIDSTINQQ